MAAGPLRLGPKDALRGVGHQGDVNHLAQLLVRVIEVGVCCV